MLILFGINLMSVVKLVIQVEFLGKDMFPQNISLKRDEIF